MRAIHSSIPSSIPKWLQWLALGQTEASSQELYPDLPCVCQEHKHLGHFCCSPECISREVDWSRAADSHMECRYHSLYLNSLQKECWPHTAYFKYECYV